MTQRGCIVAKLVARMMGRAGITHVLTIDLHSKEVRSAYSSVLNAHRPLQYPLPTPVLTPEGAHSAAVASLSSHACFRRGPRMLPRSSSHALLSYPLRPTFIYDYDYHESHECKYAIGIAYTVTHVLYFSGGHCIYGMRSTFSWRVI